MRPNKFRPSFSCNLSNTMCCYTNYRSEALGGWESDDEEDEGEAAAGAEEAGK